MSPLILAAISATVGAGLIAALWSLQGIALFPDTAHYVRRFFEASQNVSIWISGSVLAAILAWILTGWPSAALWVVLAGFSVPFMRESGPDADDEIAKVEAIATWTEQVRDTLAAAAGLQQALIVAAKRPPQALELELQRFARRAPRDLTAALRQLGNDLAHPSADLVLAGLLAAIEMDAGRIADLLGRLAAAARSEASMRVRVEVGRARIRTSMQIVGGAIAATVLLLVFFGNGLLTAYDSLAGQLWLVAIGAVFVFAVVVSKKLSHIPQPDRFVSRERVQGVL